MSFLNHSFKKCQSFFNHITHMHDLQSELLSPRDRTETFGQFQGLTCEHKRGRTQKGQRPNRIMPIKADHNIDVITSC